MIPSSYLLLQKQVKYWLPLAWFESYESAMETSSRDKMLEWNKRLDSMCACSIFLAKTYPSSAWRETAIFMPASSMGLVLFETNDGNTPVTQRFTHYPLQQWWFLLLK